MNHRHRHRRRRPRRPGREPAAHRRRRDHVVLDRGRVAERWRTERWDSLHLLTPTWMTRLPGWHYAGTDPDSYLSAGELRAIPGTLRGVVRCAGHRRHDRRGGGSQSRTRLRPLPRRHRQRHLACASCRRRHRSPRRPRLPAGLARTSNRVEVLTASAYRNPAHFRPAACSWSAPRPPACRSPTSCSRRRAATWPSRSAGTPGCRAATAAWTSSGGWRRPAGSPARSIEMPDSAAARRENSLQLVGRAEPELRGADLDLQVLQQRGVRLLGRLEDVAGTMASFRR